MGLVLLDKVPARVEDAVLEAEDAWAVLGWALVAIVCVQNAAQKLLIKEVFLATNTSVQNVGVK